MACLLYDHLQDLYDVTNPKQLIANFFDSINGENMHYGTPKNPCAADRIPGGSSSGSAVAVGANIVDLSLGASFFTFEKPFICLSKVTSYH